MHALPPSKKFRGSDTTSQSQGGGRGDDGRSSHHHHHHHSSGSTGSSSLYHSSRDYSRRHDDDDRDRRGDDSRGRRTSSRDRHHSYSSNSTSNSTSSSASNLSSSGGGASMPSRPFPPPPPPRGSRFDAAPIAPSLPFPSSSSSSSSSSLKLIRPSDESNVVGDSKARRSPRLQVLDQLKATIGNVYKATITKVLLFGAFANLNDLQGISGLIHISQVARDRCFDVAKTLRVGQVVWVKCQDIKDSKIGLNMKDVDQTTGELLEEPEAPVLKRSLSSDSVLPIDEMTREEAFNLIKEQNRRDIDRFDLSPTNLKTMRDAVDDPGLGYIWPVTILSTFADGHIESRTKLEHDEPLRRKYIVNLIERTMQWCARTGRPIPETTIYLFISDAHCYARQDLPFFVIAKPKNKAGILIPDNTFTNHDTPTGESETWAECQAKCKAAVEKKANKKNNTFFFIGSNTDDRRQNLRQDVFKLSKGETVRGIAAGPDLPLSVSLAGRIHFSEFTNYKYLLNLPGNQPWSYRFKYLLLGRSVCVNVDVRQRFASTPKCEVNETWVNYFDCLLEPNADYINLLFHWIEKDEEYNAFEFRKLVQSMQETYRYFEANPTHYDRMAKRAQQKINLIDEDFIYESIYELILYYDQQVKAAEQIHLLKTGGSGGGGGGATDASDAAIAAGGGI